MKRHLGSGILQLVGKHAFGFILTAVAAAGFSINANATIVQTTNKTINNGPADFGAGNHSGGGPASNATITYDWSTATGQFRSTGRVRGTLFWDSLFSGGCSRLTIRFRNAANTNLSVRTINECGPGGDANNSQNQTAVDESFGSLDLSHVVLTTAEVRNGVEVNFSSTTISQVVEKRYPVTINNGTADFGDGGHHFGRPDEPGYITFRRNTDGTVTGGVDGVLYWDSLGSESCARMVIEHRNSNGAILRTRSRLNCGPGGDANNGANQFFISEVLTGGSLFDIRILVETTANPTSGVLSTYNFAGQVGDFEVDPMDAIAMVNERINFGFIWTVPELRNWHDLNSLELRITDGSNAILHIRFEEDGNMISVFNEATGRFGKGSPIGSNRRLQTQYATLYLENTTAGAVNSVLGTGANSPTVRIDLALRFKPSAAGRTYQIEVAAKDDFGNEDPFATAGTLTVP